MDAKQAQELLDLHWPTWKGSAEKLADQFFVHLTSSVGDASIHGERGTAQEFFGRSKVSFRDALEDLATKIAPNVPLPKDSG